jgi:hypothetical protein
LEFNQIKIKEDLQMKTTYIELPEKIISIECEDEIFINSLHVQDESSVEDNEK